MYSFFDEWVTLRLALEYEECTPSEIENVKQGFYAGAAALRSLEARVLSYAAMGYIDNDTTVAHLDYWDAEIEADFKTSTTGVH